MLKMVPLSEYVSQDGADVQLEDGSKLTLLALHMQLTHFL